MDTANIEPAEKKQKMEPPDDNDNLLKSQSICDETPRGISETTPQLSKKQKKRLLKHEKWLASKPEKRLKEKQRLKERREEARKNNIDLGPSRGELKSNKMSTSKCKVSVVLDFSFEDLMNEKDLIKCVNQFLRCYSANRRCTDPMQLHVVNFKGKTKAQMVKHNGYQHWDVMFHEETYLDIFEKEKLVYLTSDSDNMVDSLEDDKVYIIGALVDHNSQKGLCLRIAQEQGIAHGRLPIEEYLQMQCRKVLAVNHVFEILCKVSSGHSWKEALLKVIPQRKGAVGRGDVEEPSQTEPVEHNYAEELQKKEAVKGDTEKDVAAQN